MSRGRYKKLQQQFLSGGANAEETAEITRDIKAKLTQKEKVGDFFHLFSNLLAQVLSGLTCLPLSWFLGYLP